MNRSRLASVATVVAIVVIALWLGAIAVYINRSVADSANTNDAQQQLIDNLSVELDNARAQGADVESPAQVAEGVDGAEVSADVLQGETGPTGPTGEPGRAPTSVEVLAAVTEYCSSGDRCVGANGRSVTDAEIRSAVDAYCAAVGCVGPAGTPGSTGPSGPSGETGTPGVPGVPGVQGPTGETGVQGPPGSVGATGADGVPGAAGAPGPVGPVGPAAQTMTCTPIDPADLAGAWSCVVTS
jgi:Collagen triple helix repeat (20 copies)